MDGNRRLNWAHRQPNRCATGDGVKEKDDHPLPAHWPERGQAGCLRLVKGRHIWIFHFDPDSASQVVAALTSMAHDDDCDLNWFDAAVLINQMETMLGSRFAAKHGAIRLLRDDSL
ncbi:MAG: hypothetical protein D8M59_14205 [Planctomycetes bacterium]|nr:hypothetical protein [Planctomycetota bacterium]NOG55484.1 hypothetical protein [Planctomycetota bacterium]